MKSPKTLNSNNLNSNRYYLMRHGESLANRRGLIVSHPDNALNNYGLTPRGAEQVMNASLKTRLGSDTIIVSSDFLRAKETAEIVASVLSCSNPPQYDERLRERNFGNWELTEHINYEMVWQDDVNHPSKTNNKVESVGDVLKRSLSVLKSLDQRYQGQRILLVGHGDVLQILLAHYHNINPRFHRSLSSIANADLRSLAKLELAIKSPAA